MAASPDVDGFLDDVQASGADVEVLTGPACAARYFDAFDPSHEPDRALAGLRPAAVEDVQTLVRLAGQRRIALWPISRGQNLGYGGAAPPVKAVVLDLSRMNRILEVNARDAFCLVEPGVSFAQMFDHLEQHDLPVWLSVPGYGLGSMVGNALERGIGSSTHGDHAAQICGLEVVLGDGDLVRTGMGGLPQSGMWQRKPTSVGPGFDQLFSQSGYGVVTKMGLWLMPAPEASAAIEFQVRDRDGIGALVEALLPLKRAGVLVEPPVIGSYLRIAALNSVRERWAPRSSPLSPDVERRICDALGIGWWAGTARLYGLEDLLEVAVDRVQRAASAVPGCSVDVFRWRRGEPMEQAHRTVPSDAGLANRLWCGEAGAHLDLALALPASGGDVTRYVHAASECLRSAGFDYHSAFYLRDRHVLNVLQILFDRSDPEACAGVSMVYRELLTDAARRGFAVHRCHPAFAGEVMQAFAFNHGALQRLRRRVRLALDPFEVLSREKDSGSRGL